MGTTYNKYNQLVIDCSDQIAETGEEGIRIGNKVISTMKNQVGLTLIGFEKCAIHIRATNEKIEFTSSFTAGSKIKYGNLHTVHKTPHPSLLDTDSTGKDSLVGDIMTKLEETISISQ